MHNQHNHTTPNSNSPEPNNRPLNNHVQVVAPEPTSYKDGYIHGRVTERRIDNQRRHILAENTAARALLLGITLTSLLGLAIGSVFLLNHREQEQGQEVTPVLVPSPTATQTPSSHTTIIERTQVVPTNPEPATSSNSEQKILVPTQPSPISQPQSTQSQNPTTSTNPTTVQRNSAPQPSPLPSQNPTSDRTTTPTQPYTTNPVSPRQNQTSTSTDTTNQSSSGQTQNSNSTGTTTTTPSDTTNQTSTDTTQNPTQSNNSDSTR